MPLPHNQWFRIIGKIRKKLINPKTFACGNRARLPDGRLMA